MAKLGPEISFVVPCHNEEDNLRSLLAKIGGEMAVLAVSFEVIVTDDGSTDHSWQILKDMANGDPRLRIQRFRSQAGQSAATWAGIKASRGRYIVTIDADLQNDLKDLAQFLEALRVYDCVCGTRVATRHQGDSGWRILSSQIANWVRNTFLHDSLTDSGCSYRAFKRECIAKIRFFRGGHRFLPTLFKMEGFSVTEIPVRHAPRTSGQSHYGVGNRLWAVLIDLLGVMWMKDRRLCYEIIEEAGPELYETKSELEAWNGNSDRSYRI